MTAQRHVHLYCDHPGCYGAVFHVATTPREARDQSADLGWVRRDGHDYCPAHAQEAAA